MENGNTQVNIESIKQLYRDSAPLIYLFQYKEDYKQQLIKKLLDEDLQQALQGEKLKHKRSAPPFEVPQSNESLVQNSSTLFGKKIDFLDKLLNTIDVESIGSFLQKKCNTALIKGLMLSKQTNLWHGIPLNI